MTFRRAVLVAWVILALALVARAWWVQWSGSGPLPWENKNAPG